MQTVELTPQQVAWIKLNASFQVSTSMTEAFRNSFRKDRMPQSAIDEETAKFEAQRQAKLEMLNDLIGKLQ